MSKEDLIPLGQPGNEEYDKQVRAKIKGSSSPKRKLAQKISHLKFVKSENMEKRLLEIVRNPEISALQIQKVISEMLEKDYLKPRTKVELIGKMVQAHIAIHGQKTKNLNINLNLDKIIDDWVKKNKEKGIILEE